jgi:hypothetical protein
MKRRERNAAKHRGNSVPEIRERQIRESRKSEPTRHQGLCFLCKIESTCTFPKDPRRLGLYCEEFVPYEPRPVETEISKPSSGLSQGKSDNETTKYKGLCSTCENRETCQFPKLEGGVWHCEEYR